MQAEALPERIQLGASTTHPPHSTLNVARSESSPRALRRIPLQHTGMILDRCLAYDSPLTRLGYRDSPSGPASAATARWDT
jgi:hypothetical protein